MAFGNNILDNLPVVAHKVIFLRLSLTGRHVKNGFGEQHPSGISGVLDLTESHSSGRFIGIHKQVLYITEYYLQENLSLSTMWLGRSTLKSKNDG